MKKMLSVLLAIMMIATLALTDRTMILLRIPRPPPAPLLIPWAAK